MQSKLIVARAILGALLVALVLDFSVSRSYEPIDPAALNGRSNTAIVFTGAYERIDAALDLLAAGAVQRVFISGVNGNAGLSVEGFVAQFGPAHPGLQRLVECCIAFGTLADTTLQNALETRCWVRRNQIPGAVMLVTSTTHMGRARAALASLLPGHEVIAYPVARADKIIATEELRSALREYSKQVVTQAVIYLPGAMHLFPDLYGPWRDGCPVTKGA